MTFLSWRTVLTKTKCAKNIKSVPLQILQSKILEHFLLFTADSQLQPNFNTKGITMISLALLCDAIIGNVQEKNMKTFQATNAEVVLYSYAIGFVYLFLIMLISGDLVEGFEFFGQVSVVFQAKMSRDLTLIIPETFNQLRLRLYLFRHWIFGDPSGFNVGEDFGSLCGCYGHHNAESSYHSDFVCVFQQTIYHTVSILRNVVCRVVQIDCRIIQEWKLP